MRRSTSRRTLCAALLAASLWVPTAAHPAAAHHTAAVQRPVTGHPDKDDCPRSLGRKLTSRLDKAMDDVGKKRRGTFLGP
ncbi:hypothetical protein ACIOKD_30260 [Streptomyces sp. NPDC087844]|uniref:hypothetical protein n=1 Tax=Streptomyces sp. NPDC087844 TaxID=3365805 RepID=UPI0037F475BA